MGTITTKDGVEIFYKDWGKGQPIVFSHGWPLSADDWDTQMLFFLGTAIVSSRTTAEGTGAPARLAMVTTWITMPTTSQRSTNISVSGTRSTSAIRPAAARWPTTWDGTEREPRREGRPDQRGAAADGEDDANPGGLPKEVFDGLQAQLAANRSQFYRDLPAGPFYGFNRPGVKASEAIIQDWWRQGMMGGAKAHYDGIVAFSQTDFTEDLKKITVPVLVMHGDDDQIVPYADSAPLSAKLLRNGTLKTYKGFPHGMPTTQAETINADLLAFIES